MAGNGFIVRTVKTRDGRRLRSRVLFSWLCVSFLFNGCRSNSRYDSIEAELRTRNRELEEARAELQNQRIVNGAYGRSMDHLPCAPEVPRGALTTGTTGFPVSSLTLGMGTGGLDNDGRPGDEMLQVVIVPKDDDGQAVKVPSKATIQAFEVSREGLKTPIGAWEIPMETLKKHWKSNLLGAGYSLPLQWDKPPGTERVKIIVRLTLNDGKSFEAEKEVKVKPLPGLMPPHSIPLSEMTEELPFPAARMKPARAN